MFVNFVPLDMYLLVFQKCSLQNDIFEKHPITKEVRDLNIEIFERTDILTSFHFMILLFKIIAVICDLIVLGYLF